MEWQNVHTRVIQLYERLRGQCSRRRPGRSGRVTEDWESAQLMGEAALPGEGVW